MRRGSFGRWALTVLLTGLHGCGGSSPPQDTAAEPRASVAVMPSDAVPSPFSEGGTATAVMDRMTDREGNVYQRGIDRHWRKWDGSTWIVVRDPNETGKPGD